ncbi:hypothetical protein B0H11DRAFT_17385 [Mycena galericulata]|nr:hypothetical protein B0H11DRAFT_17385 [Mycena galericulata]
MYDSDDALSYSYSSRSSTPGMPELYGPAPTMTMANPGPSFASGSSFGGSTDDWSSSVGPYAPNPFRYNNPKASSAQHPVLGSDLECGHCVSSKRNRLILETENSTLKSAYKALLQRVGPAVFQAPSSASGSFSDPDHSHPLPALPSLKESDYPDVPFFHHHQYMHHLSQHAGESNTDEPQPRGSSRASKGINVTMRYVTFANGEVIDGYRATAIRGLTNELFVDMGAKGQAPETWTRGSIELRRTFSASICRKFPEMGLCEGDWKVQYMAKAMYSSWHSSFVNGKAAIKKEAGVVVTRTRAKKRIHQSDEDSRNKRAKVENPEELNGTAMTIGTDSSDITMHPVNSGQPLVAAIAPPLLIVNPLLVTPMQTSALSGPSPASSTTAATIVAALNALNPPPTAIDPNTTLTVLNAAPPALNTAPTATTGMATAVTATALTVPSATPPPALHSNTVLTATTGTATAATATAPPPPPPPPTASGGQKESKAVPGPSTTPRNLCMREWCNKHSGGTLSQFKIYWAALETADKEMWTQSSVNAAASKTKAAN